MAAFADGEKHEREREQIRRIAESFRSSALRDVAALVHAHGMEFGL